MNIGDRNRMKIHASLFLALASTVSLGSEHWIGTWATARQNETERAPP